MVGVGLIFITDDHLVQLTDDRLNIGLANLGSGQTLPDLLSNELLLPGLC